MDTYTQYEYELVGIEWCLDYDYAEGGAVAVVRDDDGEEKPKPIEYDENGIPMGASSEEIKIRKQLIYDFYERWKIDHPEKAIQVGYIDP